MDDFSDRFIIGTTILLFSLSSLALNTVVAAAVLNSWKGFRAQPYTQFLFSMGMAGTIYTATNFFVSIPCAYAYCPYLNSDTLLIILSLPNTLSFIAYLLANFGFAIYRCCIVFSLLSTHRRSVQLVNLCLPWILAVYAVADTTSRGCIKRFNRYSIGYTYNCSDCNVWFGISFIDVNFYAGQILPILMCGMYGIMIADIYWKKSNNRGGGASKRSTAFDMKLAFQYLLVCLVQYLASFLFYIIPKFANRSLLAVIAMNVIGVIDMGLNPLILLIFNSSVRQATALLLENFLCASKVKPRISTVVTMYPHKSTI
uniref:Uncharacterized protein n=1 Tax=Caenorhabditis japonica TaxID=281687 RepID=A0A8R1HV75_CAEJA